MNEIVTQVISTIQGEGRNVGVPSLFIRFGICNLICPYCDTKWSTKVQSDKLTKLCSSLDTPFDLNGEYDRFVDIVEDTILERNSLHNIVFTGGEPFLYTKTINNLLQAFDNTSIKSVEIETNGTLINCDRINEILDNFNARFNILLNISPKLSVESYKSNKSVEDIIDIHLQTKKALKTFSSDNFKYLYKFIYHPDWEQDIMMFINRLNIDKSRIYMMPFTPDRFSYPMDKEWSFIKDLRYSCQDTANFCIKYGFKYSPREHIFVYGDMKNEAEEIRR